MTKCFDIAKDDKMSPRSKSFAQIRGGVLVLGKCFLFCGEFLISMMLSSGSFFSKGFCLLVG